MLKFALVVISIVILNSAAMAVQFDPVMRRAAPASSDLVVTANPTNPVIIPMGSGTTVGSFKLVPPYFMMNSVGLKWTGRQPLIITGVVIMSNGLENLVTCVLDGQQIRALFPANVNSKGRVVLEAKTSVMSTAFGCGGLDVGARQSYDIPATLMVIGQAVDADGAPSDMVSAEADLRLQ